MQMPFAIVITLIIVAAFLIAVIVGAFIWLPEWITSHLQFTSNTEYFAFLASTRSSVATMLGTGITGLSALAAVATVYGTFRTYLASLEKQSSDVLAKATELLGSEQMTIRIGGVYALRRLSETSPKDYLPVVGILTSFLRNTYSASDSYNSEGSKATVCPGDAQAILYTLGQRRKKALENSFHPDLSYVGLHRARFVGDWSCCGFEGARLVDADFSFADLTDSDFTSASLIRCRFSSAILRRSSFKATVIDRPMELTQAQVESALGNYATMLPGYLSRPKGWTS